MLAKKVISLLDATNIMLQFFKCKISLLHILNYDVANLTSLMNCYLLYDFHKHHLVAAAYIFLVVQHFKLPSNMIIVYILCYTPSLFRYPEFLIFVPYSGNTLVGKEICDLEQLLKSRSVQIICKNKGT